MKKCIFLFIGFLLFANCISFSQIPSYVPTNGLVGYWPFNGNANDESGNGNNGTVNGATLTTDRFGNVGKAYSFKGSKITTSFQGIAGKGSRTICFWYKTDSIFNSNSTTDQWCLVGYGGTNTCGSFFNCNLKSQSNNDLGLDGGGSLNFFNTNSTPSLWHNFIITYDSSFGSNMQSTKVYVDGVFQSSSNYTFGPNCTLNSFLSYPLTFGANPNPAQGSNNYVGKLDDIAIYTRALTQSEITSLYTANSCIANITNNDTTICKGSSVTLNAVAVISASVSDINGNVYPTVNIGTQTWMQKNLNVSKYKNGDVIPQVTDSATWKNLTTGAWCWNNNDSTTYWQYGKLYNWYAVNDPRGIAPLGWHVPTETEWNKLVKCIDPASDTVCQICTQSAIAGGAMKEAGTTHWLSPNTGATNSSGFAGLPGSLRTSYGTFNNIGGGGVWWSSSAYNSALAWNRFLSYDYAGLRSSNGGKSSGFSVRLLKDINSITYLWSTGATTPSITVSPTVTTKYYCTVSDGVTFCKDSVTVTVSTIATNIITADTVKVCGTSTTITAIAGLSSYSWSNGATTQATIATSSGWYKCTATNGACSKTDSVYVSLFNPKILQNDTAVCNGSSIVINLLPNYSGTVNDIDGNTYASIQYGNQTWMSENLKTTRYANGDSISVINAGPTWYNTTS